MALCEGGYAGIERVWINGNAEPIRRVKSILNVPNSQRRILTYYGPMETAPDDALIVPGADSEYAVPPGMRVENLDSASNQRWVLAPRPDVNGIPVGNGRLGDTLASGHGSIFAVFPNVTNATDRRAEGVGVAFLRLHQPALLDQHEEQAWGGIPQFEVLVRGIEFAWPADTTGNKTPVQWTDNAAALLWWYLTTRLAVEEADIDLAAFRAAYAKCEEAMPGGGKRYTVNGILKADDDPATVIRELMAAMAGTLVLYDGKFFIHAGAERPAVKTIVDADIIETLEIRPAPAYRDRVNAFDVGMAQSADNDWTAYELPAYEDTVAQARDGRRLPLDLGTRAFVQSRARLQQLSRIELRRGRAQAVHVYRCRPRDDFSMLALVPGERLLVTDGESGLAGAKMEVVKTRVRPDWSVVLTLRHSPDGIYADDAVDLPPVVAGPAVLPPIIERPPNVSGLTATGSAVFIGGSIRSSVSVTWADSGYPAVLFITGPGGFQQRAVSRQLDGTTGSHTFIVQAQGEYTVSARHVGADGVESVGAVLTTATVEWDVLTPGAVPSPRALPFAVLDAERYGLTLGVLVEWGATVFDVVARVERGDYQEEKIVESGGQSSTRFVVTDEGVGTYTVTLYLQHRATGLTGPSTTLSAEVSTSALVPAQPVVVASAQSEKADDGAIRSRVRLSWGGTLNRARVRIWRGTTFEAELETIEEEAEFDVPNEGTYSWSVTLFNAAGAGTPRTGTVSVSWAHLAPVSVVDAIRLAGAGQFMEIVLRQPVERDIDGIDLRYRRQDIDEDDPLPAITASNWDNAPRLETAPIVVGFLGNNVIVSAIVPETGRYRVYGRWVSRAGLRGPVGEIGTAVYAVPTGNAGSQDFSILWPGTLTNVGPLPDSDHGSILVFDPGDFHELNRRAINGEDGWPFGRVIPWQADFPVARRFDVTSTSGSERIRWRVGAGSPALGNLPHIRPDLLAEGVAHDATPDGGPQVGWFIMDRSGGLVRLALRILRTLGQGARAGAVGQYDPVLSAEVEQDGLWRLAYGSTVIDVGGPDHDGAGAVRDPTNPYLWTPQTSAQAALGVLLDGLVGGTITDDVHLLVGLRAPATYVTTTINFGKVANWVFNVSETLVQPPNPAPPNPQAPTPFDDTIAYTVRYGETEALGNTVTLTRGVIQPGAGGMYTRRSDGEALSAAQYARIELALADTLSGTGLVVLRGEWVETL